MKQVTKIMGARDRKDVNSMVDDSHESIADVSDCLNTHVLPKWNCSNCKHFRRGNGQSKEIVDTTVGMYSIECDNIVHPLLDCILRGFEAHSEQPGFSQTLNK